MDASHDAQVLRRPVTKVTGRSRVREDDALAVERALSIRVDGRELATTLRTPGSDPDLTMGFLASEGVISRAEDVASLTLATSRCDDEADTADVSLAAGVVLDWAKLERHFAATASCGLCGRVHLEALRAGLTPVSTVAEVSTTDLLALSARVGTAQRTFSATGGLHAAAWCDASLTPRVLREDIGRHNAVDKVCGWLLASGLGPAPGGVLWVSGRAGAELVLKAARAGIPVMAAVGAPSSLAVALAEAAGMTLIGFLRDGRMNVYCGEARVTGD